MRIQATNMIRNAIILALGATISTISMAKEVRLIATPKGALLSSEVIQQNGGALIGAISKDIQTSTFTVNEKDAQARIDELMATGKYEAVELSGVRTLPGFIENSNRESLVTQQNSNQDGDLPNDPLFDLQYHWLDRTFDTPTGMGFSKAWKLVDSKQDVTIAFVDGGFAQEGVSDDFAPTDIVSVLEMTNFTVNGVNYYSTPGDSGYSELSESECETAHGLGVSGIATAKTNNDNLIAGIADSDYVHTMAIQASICDISLSEFIANGIRLAAGGSVNGVAPLSRTADIINVSIAGEDECPVHTQAAVDFARSQGAVVVVAAGNNDHPVENYSPANCDGVITVGGGTDWNSDLNSFTNHGEGIDIVARGDSLISLSYENSTSYNGELGTEIWSGTSFAAPQIAGVLAMAKTTSPSMDYDTMLVLLQDTATPMSGEKCDEVGCDNGLLNAERFMLAVTGIENGTAGVISSGFSSGELCDDTLYTMIDGVRARLCQSGTVTLTNFLAPEHTDVTVRFMVSPAFEALTLNNGQVLYEGDDISFPLADLTTENVEYGYQLCHSGACLDTIYPVEVDEQSLAACGL